MNYKRFNTCKFFTYIFWEFNKPSKIENKRSDIFPKNYYKISESLKYINNK